MSHESDISAYLQGVKNGTIPACQWIRLAVKRHEEDLQKSLSDENYPYYFDIDAATHFIEFCELQKHTKGKWRGQSFVMEPWQKFAFAVPFGWKRRSDELRRYRRLYVLIPRKNGKSLMGALIGLYMLLADNEGGPEVYSGATTEKQAKEVFNPAWHAVSLNPPMKTHFGINLTGSYENPTGIFSPKNGGRFVALVGIPRDGQSPSCSLIDEYHEANSSGLFDTMVTGAGAREQPIVAVITTAGTDISVPCYEMEQDAKKVLQGVMTNDEWWVILYTIDDGDDWKDFEVWKKANPNLGISVFEDFLSARHKEALDKAERQNIILCKHLNRWTSSSEAFINMAEWDKLKKDDLKEEDFEGEECAMGMDLASKIDIAAYCKLFKRDDKYYPFLKYYLPEKAVMRPENDHYRRWADEGRLIVTPGASTDYLYIEEDIKDDAKRFQVRGLGYDPYESGYLVNNLSRWESDIIQCIEVSQTAGTISGPMKDFEGLVESGNIVHDGDPILKWMVSNVVKKVSRHKKYYPSRENQKSKIDGAMTIFFCLIVWAAEVDTGESVYDGRGLIII